MDETWIISYFVAQDNTWMMQAVTGRDACRSAMGRLCSQFPAIQFVSAVMQPYDPIPVPSEVPKGTTAWLVEGEEGEDISDLFPVFTDD